MRLATTDDGRVWVLRRIRWGRTAYWTGGWWTNDIGRAVKFGDQRSGHVVRYQNIGRALYYGFCAWFWTYEIVPVPNAPLDWPS